MLKETVQVILQCEQNEVDIAARSAPYVMEIHKPGWTSGWSTAYLEPITASELMADSTGLQHLEGANSLVSLSFCGGPRQGSNADQPPQWRVQTP